MPGTPQEGTRSARDAFRQEQELAAQWVEDFLAPGYGPHGGTKLLADDSLGTLVRSAALALADAPSAHPALQPYRDLARAVQRHAGDQATAATLLAARLVRRLLGTGLPRAACLEGLRLARRQAMATLDGLRTMADLPRALGTVSADRSLVAEVARGLPDLGRAIDLDDIDVRAEDVAAPEWSAGLIAEPQAFPPTRAGHGGVLLLHGDWTHKPRAEGATLRLTNPGQAAAWGQAEAARRGEGVERLVHLGVRFLACSGSIDADVLGRLGDAGIATWTSCPLSALRRLSRATGASPVATPRLATARDVGQASWVRRQRPAVGWTLTGGGPSATLLVPGATKPGRDAAVEDAERVLRAAGAVLADPGAVPGGGRWQRHVAASLRKSADAAPGKAPLAIAAAAQAIDALADDLVRNAGRDPLDQPLLADATQVLDAAACVRLAVAGAFDAASSLLRLDARHSKRPSTPAGLRGGLGRSGSPRGVPGDLPPLM